MEKGLILENGKEAELNHTKPKSRRISGVWYSECEGVTRYKQLETRRCHIRTITRPFSRGANELDRDRIHLGLVREMSP